MDETNTSLVFLGVIGGGLGLVGGLIAFFFGTVLWKNLEEIPDDGDSDDEEVMA